LKERFLPPLTTLVTRLIATTWSFSSKPLTSIFSVKCFIAPSTQRPHRGRRERRGRRDSAPPSSTVLYPPCAYSAASAFHPLELQPALAGGVGQRLHPPVILESAAVEDDGLDALLLGPGSDEL